MSDIATNNDGAVEGQLGLDGVLGQLSQNLFHRAVEVDADDVRA